jgi:hypothetical protein
MADTEHPMDVQETLLRVEGGNDGSTTVEPPLRHHDDCRRFGKDGWSCHPECDAYQAAQADARERAKCEAQDKDAFEAFVASLDGRCPECGHRWGAYEDTCHCDGGVCHNAESCGVMDGFDAAIAELQASRQADIALRPDAFEIVGAALDRATRNVVQEWDCVFGVGTITRGRDIEIAGVYDDNAADIDVPMPFLEEGDIVTVSFEGVEETFTATQVVDANGIKSACLVPVARGNA